MKLDFNFTGKTLLKDWWKQVKTNFQTVQDDFNSHVSDFNTAKTALENKIISEADARNKADTVLQNNINKHAAEKATDSKYSHVKLSDSVTSASGISGATAATPAAVKTEYDKVVDVQSNLDTEKSNRQNADTVLQQNIDTEATDRQNADTILQQNINTEALVRASADTVLDGGDFEDEVTGAVDCGGFEPIIISTDTRETFVGTCSGNVNMGGSHWYRGTAMSGTVTTTGYYSFSACPRVKVDDIYFNTSNGNIYACTTAGSGTSAKWTYVGCIKGATGAAGQDKQAVYSTAPTQVGTWINGNPVYRYAFSGNTSSLTKATSGTYSGMYKIDAYSLIDGVKSLAGGVNMEYVGIIHHSIRACGGVPTDNNQVVVEDGCNFYIPAGATKYYGYVDFAEI